MFFSKRVILPTNDYLCNTKSSIFAIVTRRLYIIFLLLLTVQLVHAHITGQVLDANDDGPVPYASVMYRGN